MSNPRNFTHSSNFFFGTNLFGEETIYSIQNFNLPGISFTHIDMAKSSVRGVIEGDTILYNDLSINIILDEKLEVWKDIITTMQKMRNPYTSEGEYIHKRAWLEIHDDFSKIVLKIWFEDVMIESIDDIPFASNQEDEIITLGITLKYDYFTIDKSIPKPE